MGAYETAMGEFCARNAEAPECVSFALCQEDPKLLSCAFRQLNRDWEILVQTFGEDLSWSLKKVRDRLMTIVRKEGRSMRLLIAGEMPGSPEDESTPRQDWPITRTLDSWLFRAGWDRGDVLQIPYVNVYPYYVTDEEGFSRAATREEVRETAHILDAAIQAIRPDGVMTLGALALWAFVPNVRHFMEKDGGSQYRCTRAGLTFPVIPFPHPSESNRIFRDEAGGIAVSRAIDTLSRLKTRVEDASRQEVA